MLTKILHWIDDKLLGEYIVLAIICIIVLIGGFWLYKADISKNQIDIILTKKEFNGK